MNSTLSEVLYNQARLFRNKVHKDVLAFNETYQPTNMFSISDINTREYQLQKYMEKRLEHYVRSILVNDVFRLLLEDKGIGVYNSDVQTQSGFFTNDEYEEIAGYEFIADSSERTVCYRYTKVESDEAIELLNEFVDVVVYLNWDLSGKVKTIVQAYQNGKVYEEHSLLQFFSDYLEEDDFEDYISFIVGIITEYQEYIGVKSVPKLSPYELGKFRFVQEKTIIDNIADIKKYKESDDKIKAMNIEATPSISYGYTIIDEENKERFKDLEEESKKLLFDAGLLNKFTNDKLYKYLLGTSDFACGFTTSEYLYKQYDCDDCFDYTAIISGYLKSVEQLLYQISLFSLNQGYEIKQGTGKDKNGKKPEKKRVGNVFKIKFIDDNTTCIDSTMGSMWHFFDDNKEDLLIMDPEYKKIFINCLECYCTECRNDSFHKHNINKWSRVEFVRRNTFFLYIILLAGCRLGKNEVETDTHLKVVNDLRVERLCNLVSTKNNREYVFIYKDDNGNPVEMNVQYVGDESSYPTYDEHGLIKNVILSFKETGTERKVFVFKQNIPEEIWMKDSSGNKIKVE